MGLTKEMNERIKELCILAGASPLPGSTGLFVNGLDPEKFAELIIRDVLEDVRPELTDMEVDCFVERYFDEEDEVFDD